MNTTESCVQDVMQVCRNGHVITDLLNTFPERAQSHCERCGATTLSSCPTCARELPGAIHIPDAVPMGNRQPPKYCSRCGAAFPWTRPSTRTPANGAVAVVQAVCRRVPAVIRQLRTRHGGRTSFRVEDEYDLEDLMRSLLSLHFDDVRLEARTPSYSSGTRTDFVIAAPRICLTCKLLAAGQTEQTIVEQVREDAVYHARQSGCRELVVLVYDPEQVVLDPEQAATVLAGLADELRVRAVIAR